MNMDVRKIPAGMLGANCYILTNGEKGEALVIDPGGDEKLLSDIIKEDNARPVAILLTHGHFDHFGGAEKLRDEFGIKVYVSEDDKELMKNPKMNASLSFAGSVSLTPDETFKDGDILPFFGGKLKVIATPGHTKGSVCFYAESEHMLFSGDTLFFEGVGRTDLPTGSVDELRHSLFDKLLKLPDETKVFTGHGVNTTISHEKENYLA